MRNIILPDMSKISAVFPALQMLILSTAELQIRQDEVSIIKEHHVIPPAPPPTIVIARSEATWQSRIPYHARWIATSLRSSQWREKGRRRPETEPPPPARRRLQPASYIKAKLPLCTLGYAERKIPYLMLFADRHGIPALQAGAKQELFLYMRRRIQPTHSGEFHKALMEFRKTLLKTGEDQVMTIL